MDSETQKGTEPMPPAALPLHGRAQTEYERIHVPVHYDHEAAIFKMVLDERMAYSTGIWASPDDTLQVAQNRKYASIAARLQLKPGERALDVGCGWGSVLLYLAQNTQATFDAVTLSHRQRAELLERAEKWGVKDRLNVQLTHFEDFPLQPESYDAIYFVGSIVHMEHREAIIARCAQALKPGGRFFISDCYFPEESRGDRDSRANHYILYEVLGFCLLRKLNEELRDLEKNGLDVLHLQYLNDSYVKTLAAWIDRIRANRKKIEELSPGFAHTLQSYMTVALRSFHMRSALEYMILAHKNPGPGKMTVDPATWSVP
jgi:cyclopropane-fatty-acyl-phospholipid synthase